jgi:hypothetical protein
MKKFLYIPLVLSILFYGCSDFDSINENPNEPTALATGVLFTSALRGAVKTTANESFLLGNNIAQLTAKTLRAEVDFYKWNAFPTLWEGLYESLTDLNQVIAIAEQGNNDQAKGAAMVTRAWVFSVLTQAYGDIPYSEAGAGADGNFTPIYDNQEAIYKNILSELEQGAILLGGSGSIPGDLLYNGSAAAWQKFANSLQLRLLLRAGNSWPEAQQKFNSIVATGNIFKSNEDQAALAFISSFPNQFPTKPLKQGDFDAVAIGQAAVSVMENLKDPRISRYARPDNDNFSAGSYTGVQNGVGGQSGSRLGVAYFNYPGLKTADQLGVNSAQGLIMTHAELLFIQAEAAAKGWTNESIESLYKAGIKASHEFYQADYASFGWSDFEDFYTNSGVAYSVTTDVWEQHWLALFFTGMEPYFAVRDWYVSAGGWDGIPFLNAPIGVNSNNYELPMRFQYPGQEQSLNATHYQEASARYNSDNINAKMWLLE